MIDINENAACNVLISLIIDNESLILNFQDSHVTLNLFIPSFGFSFPLLHLPFYFFHKPCIGRNILGKQQKVVLFRFFTLCTFLLSKSKTIDNQIIWNWIIINIMLISGIIDLELHCTFIHIWCFLTIYMLN